MNGLTLEHTRPKQQAQIRFPDFSSRKEAPLLPLSLGTAEREPENGRLNSLPPIS